jgi:hypothetical protein
MKTVLQIILLKHEKLYFLKKRLFIFENLSIFATSYIFS